MCVNLCCNIIQINNNGIISFGMAFSVPSPQPLPLYGTHKIIAPCWDDVDTSGSGKIFYRQITNPILLARATSELRVAFPGSGSVTIHHLLISTWFRVGYSYHHFDKVKYVFIS